jgi:hypothetical protein
MSPIEESIVEIENKLMPNDATVMGKLFFEIALLGLGKCNNKELLHCVFQLGLNHLMLAFERKVKFMKEFGDASTNQQASGDTNGPATEAPIVGDTDQLDQVCERDPGFTV